MATNPLKKHSAEMTDGPSRAPARAMLKAIGFNDEDLAKPLIGVATTWIETMPCNYNQRELAQYVKEGIREAGGTPMEFNTISVSDGVAMGTEGMRGSLVSREVITDSIETVARGHSFDGLVVLVGCDKTLPAGAMALARLNLPGLAFYNGIDSAGTHRRERHHDSGCLRGGWRSRRREDRQREAEGHRGRRVSGRGRLRGAVHRQHDGDGARISGHQSGRRERRARSRQCESGGCAERRSSGDGAAEERDEAARHHDARCVRERHRRRRRDGRVDQCGAAPAGDSARGGRVADHRRFR